MPRTSMRSLLIRSAGIEVPLVVVVARCGTVDHNAVETGISTATRREETEENPTRNHQQQNTLQIPHTTLRPSISDLQQLFKWMESRFVDP